MSDIDLIVRVPEDEYKIIKTFKGPMVWAEHLIKDGIPLPKGHGKIIDESQITEVYYTTEGPIDRGSITLPLVVKIIGTNAPAIVEPHKCAFCGYEFLGNGLFRRCPNCGKMLER
jgi:hypothetical protein